MEPSAILKLQFLMKVKCVLAVRCYGDALAGKSYSLDTTEYIAFSTDPLTLTVTKCFHLFPSRVSFDVQV